MKHLMNRVRKKLPGRFYAKCTESELRQAVALLDTWKQEEIATVPPVISKEKKEVEYSVMEEFLSEVRKVTKASTAIIGSLVLVACLAIGCLVYSSIKYQDNNAAKTEKFFTEVLKQKPKKKKVKEFRRDDDGWR